MKSYVFLFWAYCVIWLGLAGYLSLLLARMRGLQRRVEGLERELSTDRPPAENG